MALLIMDAYSILLLLDKLTSKEDVLDSSFGINSSIPDVSRLKLGAGRIYSAGGWSSRLCCSQG